MHTRKEEEKALNIKEEATDAWREEHNIPGTESLLESEASGGWGFVRTCPNNFYNFRCFYRKVAMGNDTVLPI